MVPDASLRKKEEEYFTPPKNFVNFIASAHGNNQALYASKSIKYVYHAAGMIREAVKSKTDLSECFYAVIDYLSKKRNKLAVKLKARDATLFGKPLGLKEPDCVFTILDHDQYQAYGNRILKLIQEKLKLAIKARGTNPRNNLWKAFGDENSRFYVKVLTLEELKKFIHIGNTGIVSGYKANKIQDLVIDSPLLVDGDVKISIKSLGPALIQLAVNFKSNQLLQFVRYSLDAENKVSYPAAHNLKSHYVLAFSVLKIDGVWRTMSTYATWLYAPNANCIDDAIIDQMGEDCLSLEEHEKVPSLRKQSQVMIVHALDPEKRGALLKNICSLFTKAVTNTGEGLDAQTDEMSFKLIESNFWFRGTAAISKYLRCAVYKSLGYELIPYHPDKEMDLEIHCTPYMPNFIKKNPGKHIAPPTSKKTDS